MTEQNNHEVANVVFTGQDSDTASVFVFEGGRLEGWVITKDKNELTEFYKMLIEKLANEVV